MLKIDNKLTLTCPKCTKLFLLTGNESFAMGTMEKTNNNPNIYTCDICDYTITESDAVYNLDFNCESLLKEF